MIDNIKDFIEEKHYEYTFNEWLKKQIFARDKEIERLKEIVKQLDIKNLWYKNTIDKAIEFIKENENNISSIKDLENNKTYNSALLSVKDILQGVDKE